jgi:hypothetical protein
MINLHKKRINNTSKSNEIKLDVDAIKISNEQFKQAQRVEDSIQTYFESATDVKDYIQISLSICFFPNRQIVYVYLMKNLC